MLGRLPIKSCRLCMFRPTTTIDIRAQHSSMTPRQETSINSISGELVSQIILIRHGDRFDYANPQWLETAKMAGALLTDPPLSALGHKQARETANYLVSKYTNNYKEQQDLQNRASHVSAIHTILVSPYLRVIQTAVPTAHALGIPIHIENGLSESHATPGTLEQSVLPSPYDRFTYFPEVDPTHKSLLNVQATPGHTCPKTNLPCEAFAGRYCQRVERLARILEKEYYGKSIVCFSHAASVALVAALLKCSLKQLKFAPCGVFILQRVNDGKWVMLRNGESNEEYVSENSVTTFPWGFEERHFIEDQLGYLGKNGLYSGSLEGIGLDYFIPTDELTSNL